MRYTLFPNLGHKTKTKGKHINYKIKQRNNRTTEGQQNKRQHTQKQTI